jgi:hypothetical protein
MTSLGGISDAALFFGRWGIVAAVVLGLGARTFARITMRTGAERLARPVRYVAGPLICAINVGSALAERGIKGTGSALTLSHVNGTGRRRRCQAQLPCPARAVEDTSRSSLPSRADGSTSGIHRLGAVAGAIGLLATGFRGD